MIIAECHSKITDAVFLYLDLAWWALRSNIDIFSHSSLSLFSQQLHIPDVTDGANIKMKTSLKSSNFKILKLNWIKIWPWIYILKGFPGWLSGKVLPVREANLGSGLGEEDPEGKKCQPTLISYLWKIMDGKEPSGL